MLDCKHYQIERNVLFKQICDILDCNIDLNIDFVNMAKSEKLKLLLFPLQDEMNTDNIKYDKVKKENMITTRLELLRAMIGYVDNTKRLQIMMNVNKFNF